MADSDEPSLLERLDAAVPTQLNKFDAFPKLPSTYKQRSESRGFLTLFVCFIIFLLLLGDIGEYIWGWPDYEFSVDKELGNYLNVNIDVVVNMPCQYLSVDLRDAVGDRLFLSSSFRRDGTVFDVSQTATLKWHSSVLSARQAVAQSRKSRGFFATLFRREPPPFRPTYNYQKDGSACRVYGSLTIKKVTANLHITTLGHGYSSSQHVDHKLMNLSHSITEFSFGPYFPDITQPLDYSFEIAHNPFVAYQYFLHVVPTTYIAPRSPPLHTNQYSVTHYTRVLEHAKGAPGIFFKFDLDPMRLSIHQRTTTFVQLLIRCVGVIGGVFVCMGYAIRITTRAVEVVSGADQTQGTIAAEASGVRTGLRSKWGGSQLLSRKPAAGRVFQQGSGWVVESAGGPSSYGPTPMTGTFVGTPASNYVSSPNPYSPYVTSPHLAPSPAINGSAPTSPAPHVGLGIGSPAFGPSLTPHSPNAFPAPATVGSPYTPTSPRSHPLPPRTPPAGYGHLPPTPNPINAASFAPPPPPSRKDNVKKDE